MAALLLLVLLLSLTGCGSATGAEAGDAPAYLVAVATGEASGTGVLYQADGTYLYVLTAAHVVSAMADGGEVTLRFCDGWEACCHDIRISEICDLALMRVEAEQIPDRRRKRYQCVDSDRESFDRLQAGDSCTATGFPVDSAAVSYDGGILDPWIYMDDYGQYMIWADIKVLPGMSGGGLLDGEGRLIGILSGGSTDGELAAVPLSLILQFMTDTGNMPP